MEAKATAKFVMCTPRKVKQVLSLISNKSVERVFEILPFLSKSAVLLIEKVLNSAIANLGKNSDFSKLRVKECWVCNAPTLKRMRPGPQGRGMSVRKRTSHVTIIITDANNDS
ncbi:MAG: 50S ribosomal protein L22 [Elusimicrobiota bacterium]|jgi:large subunit ribosomal protein L22|nr:50S ribosomal protein L22 [Elusimicrobiota bacterium]